MQRTVCGVHLKCLKYPQLIYFLEMSSPLRNTIFYESLLHNFLTSAQSSSMPRFTTSSISMDYFKHEEEIAVILSVHLKLQH